MSTRKKKQKTEASPKEVLFPPTHATAAAGCLAARLFWQAG